MSGTASRRDALPQVVAEIPAGDAVVADPLPEFESDRLLLRFMDGSLIRLTTEERRSALHTYLARRRQPSEVRGTEAGQFVSRHPSQ
ncbi:hypothetical protein ACWC6I_05475 [Streptomyces sp. NPDC001414]